VINLSSNPRAGIASRSGVDGVLVIDGVIKGLQPVPIDTKLVGSFRMGARAVDWARLESVCTARYRGFESLPIRHIFGLFASRPKAEHPADTELIGQHPKAPAPERVV
jgi:hypothetical protein